MHRQTAVVIAPGRGVYGQAELGYLAKRHADKRAFLAEIDDWRRGEGRTPVSELDAAPAYQAGLHMSSVNASALIYACALADFADIDPEAFEIVAVTGNSLGWYLALAAGGALTPGDAIRLVDTMGGLMETMGVGGQLVYPLVDADWRPDPERTTAVEAALASANAAEPGSAFVSIRLGGLVVLAGTEAGLKALEAALPPADGRYPMRLIRHAAFHTSLLDAVAAEARGRLNVELFHRPDAPMIDGRGAIWRPEAIDLDALHAYTLGAQITTTYDFTKAVEVAIKEFAPDRLIVLGPGTTLGAPVAQTLIAQRWRGLASKADFVAAQAEDPFVLAMGIDDQRTRVVRAGGATVGAG